MEHLSPQAARAQVQRCLEHGKIIEGRHFREELAKEPLTFDDVWLVLRSGNVYAEPDLDTRSGEWKYRVEGSEPDGRWLVVVLSFKADDTIFLITVFCDEAKRKGI